MSATATIREQTVELPESAPMIRITAGFGSAGQKTWNLRRPVTVIGSRRPAHIVLHDAEVSDPHCVIVNSGTDVLIKDLHTNSGTWLNKERVGLATLKDGDVVTLGDTNIQVAIQVPEAASPDDSGAGLEFSDPLKFPAALRLQLLHTDQIWSIEDSVVMLGRHNDAHVRLDHQEISLRHVVLFRFGRSAALFDLGSRTGLWVNGQRCSLTTVQDGDRLTVGPFGLVLQSDGSGATVASPPPQVTPQLVIAPPPPPVTPTIKAPTPAPRTPAERKGHSHGRSRAATPAAAATAASAVATAPVAPPTPPAPMNNAPAPPTNGPISAAWERLNNWRAQLRDGTKTAAEVGETLAAREAELDARDAALRGQLHDLARFQEQLLSREREIAGRVADVQAEADLLLAGTNEAAEREADFARREQELQRRENAIAQRWSRLAATTCPHCGMPINAAPSDAA